MIAILSLIVILAFSFLVTRVATVALSHTGLSREVARFQARSALTGAGFTTTESERLVNHPVRRRIVMMLMLIGNAGIITSASSLILAFVDQRDTESLWLKIALLIGALVILWTLASSRWVDRHLSRLINRALNRYTSLEIRDFAELLGLSGEYRIVEVQIGGEHWLTDRTLAQSGLREEGVLVLGIQRAGGDFIGAPAKTARIEAEDTLIVYGHVDALALINRRPEGRRGNRQHVEAVSRQAEREREE